MFPEIFPHCTTQVFLSFIIFYTNIIYYVTRIDIVEGQEMEITFPLKAEPKTRSCEQVVYLEDDSLRNKEEELGRGEKKEKPNRGCFTG